MRVKELYFIRGLPGSGCTTTVKNIVKTLPEYESRVICSVEEYHYEWKDNGVGSDLRTRQQVFIYKEERAQAFEEFNLRKATRMMTKGMNHIFIDRPNINFREMKQYIIIGLTLGYKINFLEPPTKWKYDVDSCFELTKQGIEKSTVEKLAKQWESISDCCDKLSLWSKVLKKKSNIDGLTRLTEDMV